MESKTNRISSRDVRIGFQLLRSSARVIPAVAIVPTLILTSCIGGGRGGGFGPSSPGSSGSSGTQQILISPEYPAVPINGSIILAATVADSPGSTAPAIWQIVSHPTTGSIGTLSSAIGPTVTYTAPPTTPIYGPFGVTDLSIQSTVTITAEPEYGGGFTAVTEITITAPSVSTGIAPTTAAVPLGSTVQFYAYSVGDINKQVTFQVNGVTDGTEETGNHHELGPIFTRW